MNADRNDEVKRIFFAVCDEPAAARPRLLDELCANAPELRAEVESLLRLDPGDQDSMLRTPGAGQALMAAAMSHADHAAEPVGEIAGCTLIRKLAEGGMGAVFECEQPSPRRHVAIKLLKQGFADAGIQRRFRHEAEILGRLHHPNIAKVHDSGITNVSYSDGTQSRCAYMKMELVAGRPMTAYARDHQLDERARLELMIATCDGVRHAHAMGVVHRDLKPANILVEAPDGSSGTAAARAVPRILDFGIARVTSPDGPQASMVTAQGQLLGTLAYMSPEQMLGDQRMVDTRSDVYSLGVILYELLAGKPPLDLDSVSLAEAARMVRDVEPRRLGDVAPQYRGELETIVAKAMAKEIDQRYQSAWELGADLRRYLDREPISARPATRLYVIRKFAQRNRVLVLSTLATLIALITGTVVAVAGLVSATRSNQKLVAAMAEKSLSLERAEESEQFLRRMLQSVNPSVARGRDTSLLRELLDRMAKRIDAGELKKQPFVEARMLATLAETYTAISENTSALTCIEKAMEHVRSQPLTSEGGHTQIRAVYGAVLANWNRFEDAARELELAIRARREAGQPVTTDDALLYGSYASALNKLGKKEESLEMQRKVLELRRGLSGENSLDVASTMGNIAGSLQDLGRLDEAYEMLAGSRKIYEAATPPRLMHLTIIYTNLAALLLEMKRPQEAEQASRDALRVGAEVFKPDHQQMAMVRYGLAASLRAQNRLEESLAEFTQALSILTRAFNEQHPTVTGIRLERAVLLTTMKRFAKSETELLAVHAVLEAIQPVPTDRVKECREELVKCYEAWDAAEPGAGHGEKAKRWREGGEGRSS